MRCALEGDDMHRLGILFVYLIECGTKVTGEHRDVPVTGAVV